jgi:hypothetical protein
MKEAEIEAEIEDFLDLPLAAFSHSRTQSQRFCA